MSLTFIIVMRYLADRMHLDNEEWDIENTTLGDYSVEVTITFDHWQRWETMRVKPTNSFKEYFKNSLLNHLKK